MSWKRNECKMKLIAAAFALVLTACVADTEKWLCQTRGKTMYSMSLSGKLGSADKGCTCSEMRAFEISVFGEVDDAAFKNDFGC